jgi:predicted amidohydrolase
MRVSLLQSPSPAGDIDLALTQAKTALAAAGAAGVDVLVLPEIWLPGYNLADIASHALPPDHPAFARLSAAARAARCGLVMGYAEATEDGLFNSALCLGADGLILAIYRKLQLYGPREKAIYSEGSEYVTFDLGGRKAAMLICYDVEFAPHIAALAAQGVEIILAPTANMAPFTHVPRVTVPAMAANHGLSVVYANYCGAERDLTYTGGSLIAGPHGEVLAKAGDGPALLIADIPPRDPSRASTQATDLRSL